jgi:pimeloyl-ACP methyl ester carboxylesterase
VKVLFIHGMWSQPWVWEGWRARFEQAGHQCAAVTLPGHERSIHDLPTAAERAAASQALGRLGVAEYGQTIARAISALDGGEGVVLVGHSMGGFLALQAAAQHPQQIKAVVSVNGAAPAPVFPLRPMTLPGTLRHFANPLLYWRSLRLNAWEAGYLLFNAMPQHEAKRLAQRIVSESGRAAYQLAFGALNFAGSNRIAKENIACPVLLTGGKLDRIVPAAACRATAQWLGSQATYREYAEHAHWPLAEPGWEKVADDVLAWLNNNA